MTPQEIKKAVEYKQGHFNMVQYILKEKPEWSISVYDIEEDRFIVEKSKDYEQIRKAIKDYQTEIICYSKEDKRVLNLIKKWNGI